MNDLPAPIDAVARFTLRDENKAITGLYMHQTETESSVGANFAPLGIQIDPDEYYYTRHEVRFNTDQSKKWSLSGEYEWGKFYNGRRQKVNSGVRIARDPHVAFILTMNTIDFAV